MDAESSRAVAQGQPGSPADDPASSEPAGPLARRSTSAGNRLQATLAAADEAAEDILDSARREARELIQRAEQVATDRTAQLQTQVEILLTRANDLTQRAQALSEATRELTSSVNRVVSVEAPAVTELELGSGEVEPLIARPLPPAPSEVAEGTAQAGTPAIEETAPEAEAATPSAPPEQAPDEAEHAAATAEASPEPAEPPAEAEAAPVAGEPGAPAPPPAPATPPPPTAAEPHSGPRVSQPPPPPKPAPVEAADEDQAAETPPSPPKRRRSLFSRLRRGGHDDQAAEVESEARRPRASAEAIAEVSPGHQMLARQMLLDGLSEEHVERRLRDEFRVQDPGAVLDSLQLSGPMIPPAKDEANE